MIIKLKQALSFDGKEVAGSIYTVVSRRKIMTELKGETLNSRAAESSNRKQSFRIA
jgi:hypothetical protein